MSQAFIERHGEDTVLSIENDSAWYHWNGICWERMKPFELEKMIVTIIREIDPASERGGLISDTITLISIALARSLGDSPAGVKNFLNGEFDTVTQIFTPEHCREHNFTSAVETDFSVTAYPDAGCFLIEPSRREQNRP